MFSASSVASLGGVVLAVDPKQVRPGWTAFIVVLLLGVAVVFLLRSFVKQTKRVNFTENEDRDGDPPEGDDPDRRDLGPG